MLSSTSPAFPRQPESEGQTFTRHVMTGTRYPPHVLQHKPSKCSAKVNAQRLLSLTGGGGTKFMQDKSGQTLKARFPYLLWVSRRQMERSGKYLSVFLPAPSLTQAPPQSVSLSLTPFSPSRALPLRVSPHSRQTGPDTFPQQTSHFLHHDVVNGDPTMPSYLSL